MAFECINAVLLAHIPQLYVCVHRSRYYDVLLIPLGLDGSTPGEMASQPGRDRIHIRVPDVDGTTISATEHTSLQKLNCTDFWVVVEEWLCRKIIFEIKD